MLVWLDKDYQPRSDTLTWMATYAVMLAGEMRLIDAVPLIVAKMHSDADFLLEECEFALSKIGTDAVVAYAELNPDYTRRPFQL